MATVRVLCSCLRLRLALPGASCWALRLRLAQLEKPPLV